MQAGKADQIAKGSTNKLIFIPIAPSAAWLDTGILCTQRLKLQKNHDFVAISG